jgi:hypothetical protein
VPDHAATQGIHLRQNPCSNSLAAVTTLIDAGDDSGSVSVTLLSTTSSQPDSGLDLEDIPNDIQRWIVGTDDRSGLLRTDRFKVAHTYSLTYEAAGPAGNTANCDAWVMVPKRT